MRKRAPRCGPCTVKKLGPPVNSPGLVLSAWQEELANDSDSEFLLSGIKNGFDIIDPGAEPFRVEVDNHPSASIGSKWFDKANAQVYLEIENGNYVQVDQPPVIVSPIGAIPKPDGGIRLIHDCSRPTGYAVNDYVTSTERHRFQSVDDAAKLVKKGHFMAKVDLKSAYRSVSISKHSCKVTGLKWPVDGSMQYFYDSKLPFGAKLAPGIFHRLSQAILFVQFFKKIWKMIVSQFDSISPIKK